MSIFSRKSKLDREFDLYSEVCRLTARLNRLEEIVGSPIYSRDSYNSLLCAYVGPTVHERFSVIANHIGIEIVSNPESHAKWVAQKVGAKK